METRLSKAERKAIKNAYVIREYGNPTGHEDSDLAEARENMLIGIMEQIAAKYGGGLIVDSSLKTALDREEIRRKTFGSDFFSSEAYSDRKEIKRKIFKANLLTNLQDSMIRDVLRDYPAEEREQYFVDRLSSGIVGVRLGALIERLNRERADRERVEEVVARFLESGISFGQRKSRTVYDDRVDDVMRGDGLSVEPDWDRIDAIRDQELYDDGIDPYVQA